jgi:rhamnopyranosyl-N-acetylglucosaminyl-diphospho-decaprenol beta-1,3/1,4-galactofuranosyltransferase
VSAPTVCAMVVTYNRRALLQACLEALAAQTRPPDRVIVIDNASTDGTPEMVRAAHPDVDLRVQAENTGGAGGFRAGLEAAHATGADWAWIMDDDTIPSPTALERLLAARVPPGRPAPLLLASRVEWVDGSLHPMNQPVLRRDPALYVEAAEHGLLPIRTATFPSLMVSREAIDRFGLPNAHYFIWGDDWEYTSRILRGAPAGYVVPDSVAEHRTPRAHTPVTSAGERYYFHARNWLFMMRSASFGPAEKVSLAFWLAGSVLVYLRTNRASGESLRTVGRALRDGLGREPSSSTV